MPTTTKHTATTALTRDVLYTDDSGTILCGLHLGMSASAHVEAQPTRNVWRTFGPQGTVERLDSHDLTTMQAQFTASGLGDVACETCHPRTYPTPTPMPHPTEEPTVPTTPTPAAAATVDLSNPRNGDLVAVDHPRSLGSTYKITKVNPTTVICDEVNGEGDKIPGTRGLKAHRSLLRQVGTVQPQTYSDLVADLQAIPALGTVVTHARHGRTLFTVLGQTNGKVRMAKLLLGGDNDRYYRGINPRDLTVVPMSEVAARLAAR